MDNRLEETYRLSLSTLSKRQEAMDAKLSLLIKATIAGSKDLGVHWPLKSLAEVDEVIGKAADDPEFKAKLVRTVFKSISATINATCLFSRIHISMALELKTQRRAFENSGGFSLAHCYCNIQRKVGGLTVSGPQGTAHYLRH